MTINTHVSTGRFQFAVQVFEDSMCHFELIATDPANDVMMVVSGNLIHEVTIPCLQGARQTILCQKFKRAINCRFRKTRQFLFCLPVDFARRKMRSRMPERMQDRQALGRHSKAARAELISVFRSARHKKAYCKFLQ